jgi:hypothetical protein
VNWSLRHGDLRIAHFLALHALQIFPVGGACLMENKNGKMIVNLAVFLFVALTLALFMQAVMGRSLSSFS